VTFTLWFVIIGVLLIAMALADSELKRLPLTTALLYLLVGIGLGPVGLGLIRTDPVASSAFLERAAEVVVIISLFSAGLKLRTPLSNGRWAVPVRLAFGSMTLTVGLIALIGWALLDLPAGAAVLLGAVLAPTDPVLASDVQVHDPEDRDRLRFGLTGEAGLNDGTAFPFIMLGLGLLGLHEIGVYGWRWFVIDLLWAILVGLGIGALFGTWTGRLVIYLRRQHEEAVGVDDFLALGLIALSYGLALAAHAYGFLAVFAAGLALRRVERKSGRGEPAPKEVEVTAANAEEAATDPETAPAFMAQAVLGFSEQLERIGTVAIVVLLGGMLSKEYLPDDALWLVLLLFFVVRPLAVWLGLIRSWTSLPQRSLMAWFGIRGIGSIYYLMHAVEYGLPTELARRLTALTLAVVTASVVAHGISVTPLMQLYRRWTSRRQREAP
jgi:NhaP-type Na+/H+ or K+/H+ antiporter